MILYDETLNQQNLDDVSKLLDPEIKENSIEDLNEE